VKNFAEVRIKLLMMYDIEKSQELFLEMKRDLIATIEWFFSTLKGN
jgi:hypothetical protein